MQTLFRVSTPALATCTFMFFCDAVRSQTSSDSARPQELSPVVVGASRREQRSFDAPAAIDAVDATAIASAGPGVNLSEVLNRLPGVVVLNRQNYAQDLQLSVRGFGARSTFGIRGVRLLIDGIPATMPDGQGQVANVNLGVTDRIEVLRGPLSLLYGNAAGGVVQVFTRPVGPQPYAEIATAFGSDGLRRQEITAATRSGSVDVLFNTSIFEIDGYRDWSAAHRNQVFGRVNWQLDSGARLSVQAQRFEQPLGRDPLGLTAAQYQANPRQAVALAAQQDTGKQVRQDQLGVSMEVPITAQSRVLGRLYWGQRDVYSKLSVPASAQTAATSAGGIVDLDRSYGGVSLQLQHRGRLMDRPIISTFGIDNDRMQEQRRGFINTAGVQGALKRNEDNSVSNLDTYAQTSWLFHDRWELSAGLRSSQVRFSVRDEFIIPGNPDDSGSKTYSALSPALGLRYSPVETVNLYAQMGRGFETPTFTELAYRSSGSGLNLALAAAQGQHFELGAKWLASAGHRVDAAAFLVETENEIGVQSNSGGRSVFQNIGRTRRQGLEVSHTGQWSETLRSRVALTRMQAKFADPFSSGSTPVAAGNRLPGVPDSVMYGEVQWNPPLLARYKASAAVEMVHVGKLWVDDANSEAAAASTLVHLRLGWVHDWGAWQLRPLIRIDNLLDRQVIGSVIVNDTNRRFYEPAPGRTWLAAIQLRMKF